MAEGPYICVRVNALDWSGLGAMGAHGRRTLGNTSHCDPARSPVYGTDLAGLDSRDPLACAKALIAQRGATERKGTTRIAAELLFLPSPSWFGSGAEPDPDRLTAFTETALAEVRRRWPDQMAAWRLDLDETTPHLSVFLVPMSERVTRSGRRKVELSYRDAFGGASARLAELQTELAAAFAPFGLQRGRPKAETGAVHAPPKQMRAALRQSVEQAARDRQAAASALAEARSTLAMAGDLLGRIRALVPTLAWIPRAALNRLTAAVEKHGILNQIIDIKGGFQNER